MIERGRMQDEQMRGRREVDMQTVPEHGVTRIIRNPRICGGEPTVAGTRIPVHSIVLQWQYYRDMDRVLRAFPRLNASAVSTALEFYEANRAEIDRLIEESERAAYAAD
jgi:uncharacterized protein (DUF433 family)